MAPTSRSSFTATALAAVMLSLGLVASAMPVTPYLPAAAGGTVTMTSSAARDDRADGAAARIPVRVAMTDRGLRVTVRWDGRLARRPGTNAFTIRAVAVTGARTTVLASLSPSGHTTGTRRYLLRLDAPARDLVRDADRTVVAVTQQHDGPDGDRWYERGYATVTASGALPAGARDCSGIAIGPRADLHDCDLTGAYLAFDYLEYVNLSGAILEGSELVHAILNHATLTRATLTRANLLGTRLQKADLSGASLVRTTMIDADLTSAKLPGADLRGAKLDYADLTMANLTGADLSNATLNSAQLMLADLTGADLSGANLTGANLTGATWVDGKECSGRSFGQCVRNGRPVR